MSTTSSPPAATPNPSLWHDAQRQAHFDAWLAPLVPAHALLAHTLRLASADASFRRYLRLDCAGGAHKSLIVMDAPPDKEDCQPFVQVAQLMAQAGLRVPEVLAWDRTQGFMLLTDLGSHTLLQTMDLQAAPPLAHYLDAVETLVAWQQASRPGQLPPYDTALLMRELELFPQWYVGTYRGVTLSEAQRKVMDQAFARIVANNLAWPSVYVHRDFMPRNLMVPNGAPMLPTACGSLSPEAGLLAKPQASALGRPGGETPASATRLGVLDFQDAVYGPITYDIASLLRDAFHSWDEEFCLDVTIRYWEKARKAGLPVGDDFGEFYKGVEWMGLQRHLKVAGIFARLTLRDGKPKYLADTPRFIAYIRATCSRYIELKPLLRLVENIEGIEAPMGFAFGRV